MLNTVIGSYPLSHSEHDDDAVKIAVTDQLEAGIDLVSDGQTRYDMVEYFARAIEGYTFDDKSFITGRIGHGSADLLLPDIALAQTMTPNVKGVVTGPVTLVFGSRIKTVYEGYRDEDVYMDTARAILEIAQALVKQGVKWLQIDEPFLSVGAPMQIAKKAIESIATQIEIPVALHVCGKIAPIMDDLLNLEGITLLSHGFKGEDNQELLNYPPLVQSQKLLGLGCVDSKQRRVETVEEIAELINKARASIPPERLVLHPDCGLRVIGDRESAKAKLKNMVAAAKLAG